jgi:hypothetical protein
MSLLNCRRTFGDNTSRWVLRKAIFSFDAMRDGKRERWARWRTITLVALKTARVDTDQLL